MKKSKSLVLVTAGLVAGLVLGSVSLAAAAPADYAPTNGVAACGLQIGQSLRDAGGRLIDILADLTGLSTDEIAAERADGKSIATIAEENGIDSGAVVGEALSLREELLNERVADGTLTQEQADAMLAQMTERLDERVDTTEVGPPSWSGGQGMKGQGTGGQGMRGQGAGTGVCIATQ
ncbi:MAG: hypothetical protein U1F44_08565 [Coriobacteriia bacterium]|nr:hypothetical protein [Coriobacteriia bacterium]